MADQLSEQIIAQYKEQFNQYLKETGNTDSIQFKELSGLFAKIQQPKTEEETQEMLQDFEPDQQGYINFAEFLSLIARKMKDTITEEELLEAFKVFDKDGTGLINAAELRHYMCKLGEPQTDDEIDDLIKECGVNSEGKINYIEFVQSLMPKQ